jgi:hypothetical protein
MSRYGVEILDSIDTEVNSLLIKHELADWTFEFDTAEKRYGWCSWTKKKITLSIMLCICNPRHETTQTILHEIAHALTPYHHHNLHWLETARSIGYTGGRCYGREVKQAAYRKG